MARNENKDCKGDETTGVVTVTDTTVTQIGSITGPVHVGSGTQVNIVNQGK